MAQGKVLEQTLLDAPVGAPGSAVRAVLVATAVAGTMDILAAILVWSLREVPAARVVQSIASGVLGRDAYSGGNATAWLGVLLHYAIMSVIATIFYLAARRLDFLTHHRFLAGAAYGVVVFVVMTYVVVPL